MSFLSLKLKSSAYDLIFILILLYSLLLRINYLHPPIGNGDSQRDYLVAHHILAYGEHSQLGPWNSLLGQFASPVYYYLLASLLLIKDDIEFLQIVNIFLQVFTVGIIYMFTKKLFAQPTALIASIFYIFSYNSFKQTLDFWQPGFMLPFFILSCYFLLQAYLRKSYIFLILSLLLFVFSGTIHNSVFSLLPIYIPISLIIIIYLRKNIPKFWYYLGFILALIDILLILHFPVIQYALERGFNLTYWSAKSINDTEGGIIINLLGNFKYFLDLLFPNLNIGESALILKVLPFVFTFIIVVYFAHPNINKDKKHYLSIILGSALLPIIGLSLSPMQLEQRYFLITAIFILIALAECINMVFSKLSILKMIKAILVIVTIVALSNNFVGFQLKKGGYEYSDPIKPLVASIIADLNLIRQQEQRADINFFQLKLVDKNGLFRIFPAEIYNALEKEYNQNFTKIDDFTTSPSDLISINQDYYIFIVCISWISDSHFQTCINDFLKKYPNYSLIKESYSKDSYKVYLTRKSNS